MPTKTAKKKPTKKVVSKKVYKFLGLTLKSGGGFTDCWFVSKTLPNGGLIYIDLEKWGDTFCASVEYEGLYLAIDHCDSAELALGNLLEKLRSSIKPLIAMGV